jgi:hypothetical protein
MPRSSRGMAIGAEINGQPRSLRLKFFNVWTKNS